MHYFAEGEVSDNANVFGEINEDASLDFFEISNTEEIFPQLRLNEDYIPIGSGKPSCFHLEWIKKEQRMQMDNYMSV